MFVGKSRDTFDRQFRSVKPTSAVLRVSANSALTPTVNSFVETQRARRRRDSQRKITAEWPGGAASMGAMFVGQSQSTIDPQFRSVKATSAVLRVSANSALKPSVNSSVETRRRRDSQRRQLKPVGYSGESVDQSGDVEVDQESELGVAEPEVRQQLLSVDWSDLRFRFVVDDNFVLDD